MAIPDDYTELVNMLITATRERRVRWRANQFGVSVVVSNNEFRLWAGTDFESDRPFVSFGLKDLSKQDNAMLDSWSLDRGEEDYELLLQLFQDARRQALGVPERIATIKQILKQSKEIGDDPEEK